MNIFNLKNVTSFAKWWQYSKSSSKSVSMWSLVKAIGTTSIFNLLFFAKPLMASSVCGPSHSWGPTFNNQNQTSSLKKSKLNIKRELALDCQTSRYGLQKLRLSITRFTVKATSAGYVSPLFTTYFIWKMLMIRKNLTWI